MASLVERLRALYVWPQSVADHYADTLTPRQIKQLYEVGFAADEAADRITALEAMCETLAGFAAGKRAGMERAAEELRQIYVDCDAQYLEWNNLPPVDDEARNFAFDISRYALAALKEAGQ